MGFTSPHSWVNAGGAVVPGSDPGRSGNRKPPTVAYVSLAPLFHHRMEKGDDLFAGGAFLDGRATGHRLGNPAADQAQGPFLNPLEMALPHAACVVSRVCNPEVPASYPVTLREAGPPGICDIAWPAGLDALCSTAGAAIVLPDEATAAKVAAGFDAIARALLAWESSAEVNPFSSKFDRWQRGEAEFTAEERLGFELFRDPGRGRCAACHVLTPGPDGGPPLFTDFGFHNLGVPRNPENPFEAEPGNPEGADWVDPGLAGHLATVPVHAALAPGELGKFKVPTLRNVDKRLRPDIAKAYMHNGYFKSLAGVVKFHNTRDAWPRCKGDRVPEAEALRLRCWPAPEVEANVNRDKVGNLGLTEAEEAAIVAFLRTLTDE